MDNSTKTAYRDFENIAKDLGFLGGRSKDLFGGGMYSYKSTFPQFPETVQEKYPIINDDDGVTLEIDFPGVNSKEDFNIVYKDGLLTIKASRTKINKTKFDLYHQYTVSNTLDASTITATYVSGVLTIRIEFRKEYKAQNKERKIPLG